MRITVPDAALLPCEFCLLPLDDARLPIFRYSRYRFFLFRVGRRHCLVQQLYIPDANLTFNIALPPSDYSENVEIPNVASDIPACFLAVGDVVVAFAANHFVCLVDLRPAAPRVLKLPKGFAVSCCGYCAETIPERNAVVDIDSHEIYTVRISFKAPELLAHVIDRASLSAFALLAQRLFDPVHIADIFHLLAIRGDCRALTDFAHAFFAQLPQPARRHRRLRASIPPNYREIVHDMEVEWPSSTRVSRLDFFREQLAVQKSASEEACGAALRMLKEQNSTILVLRTALTEWVNHYRPATFWLAAVKLALHAEAMAVECPQIPALLRETQAAEGVPMSREMRYRLRLCGVFQERDGEERIEADWWRARLGTIEEGGYEIGAATGWFESLRPRAASESCDRIFWDASEPPSLVGGDGG
jgi:hypothetical protein